MYTHIFTYTHMHIYIYTYIHIYIYIYIFTYKLHVTHRGLVAGADGLPHDSSRAISSQFFPCPRSLAGAGPCVCPCVCPCVSVCVRVMQSVAVCCRLFPSVAVSFGVFVWFSSVLQSMATFLRKALQHTATHCNTLQYTAPPCWFVSLCAAVYCTVLQDVAV